MISAHVRVVPSTAPVYPPSLFDLSIRPDPLYTLGHIEALELPLVAIVGTREPTSYGLRVTRMLARAFVDAGAAVVSGMARGIDAAAHHAALERAGSTIAVLGTGIDVPYPVGHTELHRVIADRGLVISESPEGTRAHQGAFPKRNRIIAALARMTIVVEGGHKSGALNTARHALELARTLAAVPGPIDSPQSAGPNHLIRDGAQPVTTIDDALALLGVTGIRQTEPVQLADNDGKVWAALGGETLSVDLLRDRTGLGTRECLAAITTLELNGMVESLVTGEVRRR